MYVLGYCTEPERERERERISRMDPVVATGFGHYRRQKHSRNTGSVLLVGFAGWADGRILPVLAGSVAVG